MENKNGVKSKDGYIKVKLFKELITTLLYKMENGLEFQESTT